MPDFFSPAVPGESLSAARLGRTQKQVLASLAMHRSASVRTLAQDWPGLTESSVRSAVHRLGGRSFVDVAGWDDYGCRTYALTEKGTRFENDVNIGDDDEWVADQVRRANARRGFA